MMFITFYIIASVFAVSLVGRNKVDQDLVIKELIGQAQGKKDPMPHYEAFLKQEQGPDSAFAKWFNELERKENERKENERNENEKKAKKENSTLSKRENDSGVSEAKPDKFKLRKRENDPRVPEAKPDKFKLRKREHAYFQAFKKEDGGSFWTSGNLVPGQCSGGFSNTANYFQWTVSGKACRFTFYKGGDCKGPTTFATDGFSVVSDGERNNVGFKSVFIECR